MNEVSLTYKIARAGAGQVSLDITRTGKGDDMVEWCIDNIENKIRDAYAAIGHPIPEATRVDEAPY